jgi:hypothetical protein
LFGSCQHTLVIPRDWYFYLFIYIYIAFYPIPFVYAWTPTLPLHVALRHCYTCTFPSLVLSIQPSSTKLGIRVASLQYPYIHAPYTSNTGPKMAAAVAQPTEDVTASSYVGFDCKCSTRILCAISLAYLVVGMILKLILSHHPSD